MICITAATPSSSDHCGGNFSSYAQGFASSSLANSLENLLDSGTLSPPLTLAGKTQEAQHQPFPSCPFPQAGPEWGDHPDSPTRFSGVPCPQQDSPRAPPTNTSLKVAAKKGDQI